MSSHGKGKSSEPLWWIPFAGGMMLDAMVMPALIIVTGFLVPLGLVKPEGLHTLFSNLLVRVGLFVLISATFFHAAHRLRFVIPDLGFRGLSPVLPLLCYGSAIAGSLLTGAIAFNLL